MGSLLSRLYAPIVARINVPARRSTVFEILTDPETYPSWLVGAERMRHVDQHFPAPGASFEHSVGAGPVELDDHSESVGVETDTCLALRVHAGPFQARVDFELEERADGTTDVRFSERPVGAFGALTPVLRPSLQARNTVSLGKLKDLAVEREAA